MLVDDAQEMQYFLVECNNYSKKKTRNVLVILQR